MNRRTLLKWICRTLATACTLIVAAPGIGYVVAPLFRRKKRNAVVRRLVKLDDLPIGQPRRFAVIDNHRDAWTLYPQQTIGRVWLMRHPDNGKNKDAEQTNVEAFTSICPHLGCQIQLDPTAQEFSCPCHNAAWMLSGEKVSDKKMGRTNPTPRGMDSLKCRVVPDESQVLWIEVEYEKFEYGRTTKIAKG